VNMGHLGHYDERWQRGTLTERLLAQGLFAEGTPLDTFVESWLAAGWVTVNMPDGPRGALRVGPFLAQYRVSSEATPLARARGLFGWPGPVVGWTMAKGLGRATHVGTNLGHAYGSAGYYGESGERLVRARELVRALCGLSGLGPLVSVDDARGTAWARRVPGDGVFLFVGSRRGQAGTLRVRVHDLAAMGLEAGQRYVLTEALTGDRLDQATGSQLQQGLDLALPAYGTAVVRIRPARPAAAGDPLSSGGETR